MAGVNFKWYDGFFLSMLMISTIIVVMNWNRYRSCTHPLHIWTVIDYTTIFIFRILMFIDNGIAAGMGVDYGWQQRQKRFCARVVMLSILCLILYPFLWAWTIIGSLWFTRKRNCLPEDGQKWGIVIWLVLSYILLLCIAIASTRKWLARKKALLARTPQRIPSVYGVVVDMVRVPDWAFEAADREMRGADQENGAYYPGLYLTPNQREAVDALIQQLPKYILKAVPTDCNECPICLEEFHEGNEVRGLPCAHNFHVDCIDKWLRLNINCPRCRCLVFPNLDINSLSLVRIDPQSSSE